MTELVGSIMYEVHLDTSKLIADQRRVEKTVDQVNTSLTAVSKATKTHIAALQLEASVSRDAANATSILESATNRSEAATGRHTLSTRRLVEALRGGKVALAEVASNLTTGEGVMRTATAAATGVGAAFVAIAAAASAAVVGFIKGREETTAFVRSIELTGNASGVTIDRLNMLAAELDNLSGITRGKAAEALNVFVNTGVRGGDALGRFTEAAIRMEQAGGASVAQTAKAFKELEKDPVQASLKLNDAVNFLTADLLKQINTLDQQGKHTEAAKVAQEAYADAILTRTPKITENLGLVEKAWRAVSNAAKEGWDALLNIGRQQTPEERLAATRQQIADLQRQLEGGGFATTGGGAATGRGMGPKERAQKEALLAALQEQVRLYDRSQLAAQGAADADAQRLRQVQALAEFEKSGLQFLDKRAKMERDIAQARELGKQAGLSELQIEQRIGAIRASYAEKKEKFDAVGYLIGLQEKSLEGYAKIDAAEREALQKNAELLRKKEIDEQQSQQAITLIRAAASRERQKLADKEDADANDVMRRSFVAQERAAAEKKRAQDFAAGIVAGGSDDDQVVLQYRRRNEQLEELRAQNLLSEQEYSAAVVANSQQTQQSLAAIAQRRADAEVQAQLTALNAVSNTADQLLAVLRASGKERTAIAKAAFLAQKAIAVAEIIINTEVGAAKAIGQLGPFGIPLATLIRAAGYASAGIVAGQAIAEVSGGRQYGGPVSAGSLYRVNEAGPEMFVASGGRQYMMPTTNGSVVPADQVTGGGRPLNVIINNAPPGTNARMDGDAVIIDVAVRRAKAELAEEFSQNTGSVYNALRSSTNVQGRN